MSITVQYIPGPIEKMEGWHKVSGGHQGYLHTYEKEMTRGDRLKVVAQILFKTVKTLGFYLICYKCSHETQVDFANLKRRRWVRHYERIHPQHLSNLDFSKKRLSQDEYNSHLQRLEANLSSEQIQVKIINKTDLLKAWYDKIGALRQIYQKVQKMLDRKGQRNAFFLDHIYGKNRELYNSLEEFIKLSPESQTKYAFTRLVGSFHKIEDLSKLVEEAIQLADKMSLDEENRSHATHRFFRENCIKLESNDRMLKWLISLMSDRDLFNFVGRLLEFEVYSSKWIDLVENHEDLWERYLKSLNFNDDIQIPHPIIDSFNKCRGYLAKLERDWTSKDCGAYFSLGDFFKKELNSLGWNDHFKALIQSNVIPHAFLKFFISKKDATSQENFVDDILKKMEQFLSNLDHERVKKACLHCEAEYKSEQALIKKNVNSSESQQAFKRIINFLERQDFRETQFDAISRIEEMAPLVYKDPQLGGGSGYDAVFYNFFIILNHSELLRNFKDDLPVSCDETFYREFKNYFNHIERNIQIFDKILHTS
ncbi:MAG: hypothetical protein BGO14_11770 [Chlamydiales bacterium 38-26]|nr:MAG: hypothetical protein BGO14_11770 [Chlamydiales bacterium 38-26]